MSNHTIPATTHYVAEPFHVHCAECDAHIDPAIMSLKAEGGDTLKHWHGGEVPSLPEASTVAHGVTVTRHTQEQGIVATPERVAVGQKWFGQTITRIDDANTFGHYPGRVQVWTEQFTFHVTMGARYVAAAVAIV